MVQTCLIFVFVMPSSHGEPQERDVNDRRTTQAGGQIIFQDSNPLGDGGALKPYPSLHYLPGRVEGDPL
jgi:hypothetical protein